MKKLNVFLIFLVFLCGCAAIKEGAKGVAGVSTKILEEGRKTAISKVFNFDYYTCFTRSMEILQQLGSYVYLKDIKGHKIAVYISEADTTPVGIFFKEIDAQKTQVEISSPSTYAKELIAKRVFGWLDGTLDLLKEKGKAEDEEEQKGLFGGD